MGIKAFAGKSKIKHAYGSIYVNDNTSPTVISGSGIGNKVQFTFFDTNGVFNDLTPDHTNDHIIINKAGIYFIAVKITADSVVGAGAEFSFDIFINNGTTIKENLHTHRSFGGGGGEIGVATITGCTTFDINDTVELWIHNETNSQNVIGTDIELCLFQLDVT